MHSDRNKNDLAGRANILVLIFDMASTLRLGSVRSPILVLTVEISTVRHRMSGRDAIMMFTSSAKCSGPGA